MDDASRSVDHLLAAAYALDGPAANRALYARWAGTYDSGYVADSGYVYHEHVAELFADRCLAGVATDDVVVDVGCGTGLAGLALQHHRAVIVDGIDISPEMLEQAGGKLHDGRRVYRRLVEADLTQPVGIDDNTYAGALSVGTFTHGHVGAGRLAELIRIIRAGGRAAIGINSAHFARGGFAATFEQLSDDALITDLQLVDVPIYADAVRSDADHVAHVALFTVR